MGKKRQNIPKRPTAKELKQGRKRAITQSLHAVKEAKNALQQGQEPGGQAIVFLSDVQTDMPQTIANNQKAHFEKHRKILQEARAEIVHRMDNQAGPSHRP